MEKIFFVQNNDLTEVNRYLKNGGRVKAIHPVAESVAAYGYAARFADESNNYYLNPDEHGHYNGDVFAYVVLELD